MKKILLLFLLTGLFSIQLNAQSKKNPWQIGLSIGISEYSGDMGNGFFKFDLTPHNLTNYLPGGGTITTHNSPGILSLNVNRYVNRNFDGAFRAYLGEWGYYKDQNPPSASYPTENFFRTVYGFELTPRWKFLAMDNALLVPYITAGFGARFISLADGYGGELNMPIGLGINVNISDRISINFQSSFVYTNKDTFDFNTSGANADAALNHTIGIGFNLGKTPDADNDGVPDKRDKCKKTPKGDKVDERGCSIDGDKDGVADNKDACPEVKGLPKFKGCPDSDNDGVQDKEDKCPDVPGILVLKGCPDTDKDGITDAEDLCPTVYGSVQFKGCPDTDKDGIQDSEDPCPTKPGPMNTKGCPDSDGDGIDDGNDKCPIVPGLPANLGCPELRPDIKRIFDQAISGVQFETGKSIIKPSSYAVLDNVADFLIANSTYKVFIQGHTDNQGDPFKNLKLSQDRAAAVERYLESRGVSVTRVRSAGFGDSRPIYSNATKEGRAKNRRVEFKVEY